MWLKAEQPAAAAEQVRLKAEQPAAAAEQPASAAEQPAAAAAQQSEANTNVEGYDTRNRLQHTVRPAGNSHERSAAASHSQSDDSHDNGGWQPTVHGNGKGESKGMDINPYYREWLVNATSVPDSVGQKTPEEMFEYLVKDYAVDRPNLRVPGLAQIRNAGIREMVNVRGERVHTGRSRK
jgi:hypothetical protein